LLKKAVLMRKLPIVNFPKEGVKRPEQT